MTLIKHQGQQGKKKHKQTGFAKANEGSKLITVLSSNSVVFFLPNVRFYLKELAMLDIVGGSA